MEHSKPLLNHLCKFILFFGTAENWKIPVAWAFLGNKTERSYNRIIGYLDEKIFKKFGVKFIPEFFLTDYETGVIASVKKF